MLRPLLFLPLLAAAPLLAQDSCLDNFESGANVFGDSTVVFAQDDYTEDALTVIANPDTMGNPSDSVLQFVEAATPGALGFAGFSAPLGEALSFEDDNNRTISMLVWGPRAATIVIKIEAQGGTPSSGELMPTEAYAMPNMWMMLTYDLSGVSLDDGDLTNFTVIPGLGEVPTADATWYFDNFAVGSGDCTTDTSTAVRTPRAEIATLVATPNPARTTTTLELQAGVTTVTLIDGMGRVALTERLGTAAQAGELRQLDLANLPTGTYTAVTRDERGVVLGRARLQVEN